MNLSPINSTPSHWFWKQTFIQKLIHCLYFIVKFKSSRSAIKCLCIMISLLYVRSNFISLRTNSISYHLTIFEKLFWDIRLIDRLIHRITRLQKSFWTIATNIRTRLSRLNITEFWMICSFPKCVFRYTFNWAQKVHVVSRVVCWTWFLFCPLPFIWWESILTEQIREIA